MPCVPSCITHFGLAGHAGQFLGQFELPPVGDGLLAIDVLAGLEGIHGLIAVQMVRRGDTDHVHRRVGQQLVIVHVRLAAVAFDPLLEPRPVHITGRDDLDGLFRLGLEPVQSLEMRPAPPAATDEPNPQPLVGAENRRAHGRAQNHPGRRDAAGLSQELPTIEPDYA